MADRFLEDLNPRQREAVTTPAVPIAILAPAGSGKTRVLTRRLAWQAANDVIDAGRTLAVTFTRKAAGELGERLRALGVHDAVTAGTFHALALAQLRRRWLDRGEPIPAILDRKVRILAPLLGPGRDVGLAAADVAAEIEWAKARLVDPERYESVVAATGRATPRPPAELADLYGRYEQAKTRRGLVDLDDLIWRCGEALETDPEFAAAQRWRFRHLFVDEFQDVSPAQFRLVRGWLGDRPDLCVVGDDDQAIFSFTGADADYLVAFRRHFPTASVVHLDVNYRSTPQIVTAAGAVLPRRERARVATRAAAPDGPVPTVTAFDSDADEATAVARALRDGKDPGLPWRAMAVLYRTNAQSARFEEALRAAGVPARVRGAARFLERPEVVAALADLRRSVDTAPGVALGAHLTDLSLTAAELSTERRDHTEALVRLGREYLLAEGGSGSLDGMLAYLATALRDDEEHADDAVELLTFHRAKGLEWSVVFVTGLERGLVPIAFADTPAELAEERRLLYVAMTRARHALHLSWAARRSVGGREAGRRPSPYLSAVETALGHPPGRSERAAHGERAATVRSVRAVKERLGMSHDHTDGPGRAVFDALVEWRRSLARASNVPAYLIFHDSTLTALAEARPRTRAALLSLPGIGPVKADRYGDAVLDLVRRHAS